MSFPDCNRNVFSKLLMLTWTVTQVCTEIEGIIRITSNANVTKYKNNIKLNERTKENEHNITVLCFF